MGQLYRDDTNDNDDDDTNDDDNYRQIMIAQAHWHVCQMSQNTVRLRMELNVTYQYKPTCNSFIPSVQF